MQPSLGRHATDIGRIMWLRTWWESLFHRGESVEEENGFPRLWRRRSHLDAASSTMVRPIRSHRLLLHAVERDDWSAALDALQASDRGRNTLVLNVQGSVRQRLHVLAYAMEMAHRLRFPLLVVWGMRDSQCNCSLRDQLAPGNQKFYLIERELGPYGLRHSGSLNWITDGPISRDLNRRRIRFEPFDLMEMADVNDTSASREASRSQLLNISSRGGPVYLHSSVLGRPRLPLDLRDKLLRHIALAPPPSGEPRPCLPAGNPVGRGGCYMAIASRVAGAIMSRPSKEAWVSAVATTCSPPRWLKGPWTPLLAEQLMAASSLVRGVRPLHGHMTISIRNNRVERAIVKLSNGRFHRDRSTQYRELFINACRRRSMPDADVNINLFDKPRPGYFGFCRERGAYAQFLLPNHRFTLDDVFTANPYDRHHPLHGRYSTYDEQLVDLSHDAPFEQKLPRAFAMLTPHGSKIQLMKQALRTPDDFAVYVSLLPIFASKRPLTDERGTTLRNGTAGFHRFWELIAQLRAAGMAGNDNLPWIEHRKYAFLVHPPANTFSDRLRLLLPLNAVVLVDVRGDRYEDIFSRYMRPWREFVPVLPSNVSATVKMLRANRTFCLQLIKNQHELIQRMYRYDPLLDYVQELMWTLFSRKKPKTRNSPAHAQPSYTVPFSYA